MEEKKELEFIPIQSQTKSIPRPKKSGVTLYQGARKKKKWKLFPKGVAMVLLSVSLVGAVAGPVKNAVVDHFVNESDVMYYEVKYGDTLVDIANQYGTDLSTLRRNNGISSNDTIYPGQILAFVTSVDKVESYDETHDMAANKAEYNGASEEVEEMNTSIKR